MTRDLTLAITSQLVEYPHPHLAGQARAAAAWLDVIAPDAAAQARRFADEADLRSTGALEEAYTAAFDFASLGTLYAGEHLFGATESRATFLARLRALQREHGVAPGAELPDHVAELLRLAAAMPPNDDRDALLVDAVLPTARAALRPLAEGGHPYAAALAVVVDVVEHLVAGACFDKLSTTGDGLGTTGNSPSASGGASVRVEPVETRSDFALFDPGPEATP